MKYMWGVKREHDSHRDIRWENIIAYNRWYHAVATTEDDPDMAEVTRTSEF